MMAWPARRSGSLRPWLDAELEHDFYDALWQAVDDGWSGRGSMSPKLTALLAGMVKTRQIAQSAMLNAAVHTGAPLAAVPAYDMSVLDVAEKPSGFSAGVTAVALAVLAAAQPGSLPPGLGVDPDGLQRHLRELRAAPAGTARSVCGQLGQAAVERDGAVLAAQVQQLAGLTRTATDGQARALRGMLVAAVAMSDRLDFTYRPARTLREHLDVMTRPAVPAPARAGWLESLRRRPPATGSAPPRR